jgi:hypothetical protein
VRDVAFGTAPTGAALLVASWHPRSSAAVDAGNSVDDERTEIVTYHECRI